MNKFQNGRGCAGFVGFIFCFLLQNEVKCEIPDQNLRLQILEDLQGMNRYDKCECVGVFVKNLDVVLPQEFSQELSRLQFLLDLQPELIECRIGEHKTTPLHLVTTYAFPNGIRMPRLKMLIEKNNIDGFGNPPLHLMIYKNPKSPDLMETIQILIENGANPNIPYGLRQRTFPHFVAAEGEFVNESSFHKILSYLDSINKTESLTMRDGYGVLGLHIAIHFYELRNETLEIFKKKGTDFSARTYENNMSVLEMGINAGRSESVLRSLIAFGADWRIGNERNKNTALHWAAYTRNLDAVKLYLSFGFDVNGKDAYGNTPLHSIFISRGPFGEDAFLIVEYLLMRGADLNVKNNRGLNPVQVLQMQKSNGNEMTNSVKKMRLLLYPMT
ncbi:unnamed protein product [Orchesella dallaii]|uniref:Ankyrin repeat protein n=1 Tax=Orchesella dallaii TaxID=48710 RepID=A0ABP1S4M2_9HEXA